LQANNAAFSTTNPTEIKTTGASHSANDSFVVQLLGTSASWSFDDFGPGSSVARSVAFTAGVDFAPASVPGPLPLVGAGVAFGFSRRLRRRIKRCG
jgi:hypothetical protein